eukprot:CAMPEP_0114319690 /NCGR_PEP_ID=MMETSP0059-20121206/25401_1 /TAXON_ID=36894 /ORGANISM="Pyramimonas parkeae, Strain CCMP726" /LENGTH=361 /DNA_ID=CAMNT_0001446765 /DNA_START=606 /DNA_END=1691 /DNA_ORIENTATION=+
MARISSSYAQSAAVQPSLGQPSGLRFRGLRADPRVGSPRPPHLRPSLHAAALAGNVTRRGPPRGAQADLRAPDVRQRRARVWLQDARGRRPGTESGSKTYVDGDRASLLGPGKREVPGVAAAPDVEPAAASARKGKRERRIKGKRAGCCCCCAEAAATSSCGDLVGIGESRDACDSHQGDGEKVGCEDEGEQEDFGFVEMHACRVATLQQFYSLIKPSVEQMAVDAVFKERAAREAHPYDNSYDGSPSGDSFDISAAPLQPSSSGLASTECCICMDHNVQVVTECAHAFCEECHSRWCETSQVCPLCRSEMPKRSESGALDAYVLAECMLLENDEDDMDLSLRDAGERLMQFLTSLPIAAR